MIDDITTQPTTSNTNWLGVGGLISSGLSSLGGLIFNGLNYSQEKKNLEYQKQLQQTIFNREDNSVQRRALDLQNAGLSKTLAAGSGASSGAVVNTTSPQFGVSSLNEITGAIFDILRNERENKIANASITRSNYESKLLELDLRKREALLPDEIATAKTSLMLDRKNLSINSGIADYTLGLHNFANFRGLDPLNAITRVMYEEYQNTNKLLDELEDNVITRAIRKDKNRKLRLKYPKYIKRSYKNPEYFGQQLGNYNSLINLANSFTDYNLKPIKPPIKWDYI